ncbi:MAG: N-acetylglucosamine kinase [Gemmatimonadaceae bacterium]
MSFLIVGVDGGGTKTKVIVADHQGHELATATGGGSAARPGQATQAAEMIAQTVTEALAACERSGEVPRVLCAGLAGAGREPERQAVREALVHLEVADHVIVEPDATIALEDAFGDGPGILLVSGTGSSCFGRSPAGQFSRCGGWGPNIGDEGSGAWIGRRALSIVAAAADGREPDTGLLPAMLTALELESSDGLVYWASHAEPAALAKIAGTVITVAATGDQRANSLLSLAAEELVTHVRALARQLFADERAAIPVALAGGLMERGSFLRKLVETRLKSAVPGALVRAEPVVPARGAVRMALQSAKARG